MRYSERLHPAPWIWGMCAFVGIGLGLSLWPLGQSVGVATALLSGLALAGLLVRSTPRLAVGEGLLRAGRAQIPIRLVGSVEVLGAEAMRRAHGPQLDARAYLCLRGWIRTGVRVALVDPADPTPYWLLSSRDPRRLADALVAERAEAGHG